MTAEAPRSPTRAKGAAAVSAAALALATAFISAHEGEVRTPYVDRLGKGQPLTVCYGETQGVENRRYTHAECLAMLERSALKHAEIAQSCLPSGLPDKVAAPLYDMAYNVLGSRESFCRSSMSRKALAGDLRGACDAILLYNKSGGKDCRPRSSGCYGVWQRRLDAHELCRKGLR